MSTKRIVRPGDLIAILLSLAVTAGSAVYAYAGGQPAEVYIRNPNHEWTYPLSEDRRVSVLGPLGETTVLVDGDAARIVDSPCRDKICIRMGSLSASGDWSACLPNGVFVQVRGAAGQEIDALAY